MKDLYKAYVLNVADWSWYTSILPLEIFRMKWAVGILNLKGYVRN